MISAWRTPALWAAILMSGVLTCGLYTEVQAQDAKPKVAKPAASSSTSKPSTSKPSISKPAAPKAVPSPAAAGDATPNLIGQFGIWGAYTAMPSGKKVCFALAKPSSSKTAPPDRPRDPAYMFISTRPAEKVVNEVSVMIGYQVKPGSDASLDVGGAHYAMYVQGDGLWIKNAAEEEHLVDALRKGSDATVKGSSAKGTATTDVFPLKGLAQALDRLAQECRH